MLKPVFLLALVVLVASEKCQRPPPAAQYQEARYMGVWYEIGKYQTAGGAFFQRDCECTEMQIMKPQATLYAYQTCIRYGKKVGVNATLLPVGAPGEYIEQIGTSKTAYWVIYLDQDTAIEYDCQQSPVLLNYCVHIMSRSTTMSETQLQKLKAYALSFNLNTHNLPFQKTEQAKCRNTPKHALIQ